MKPWCHRGTQSTGTACLTPCPHIGSFHAEYRRDLSDVDQVVARVRNLVVIMSGGWAEMSVGWCLVGHLAVAGGCSGAALSDRILPGAPRPPKHLHMPKHRSASLLVLTPLLAA